MSKSYRQRIAKFKKQIGQRLEVRGWADQPEPMMGASNLHYELSDRNRAINCGGLGAIHLMARKIGLIEEIDQRVHVLKRHLPYHESDHVLNIAYNVLTGGVRLEDIEERRQSEPYLDGLGAQRIPDPTTSGDFTRRFAPEDLLALQEALNAARVRVWQEQPVGFLEEAFVDLDGTIAPTLGETKGGMALSYKGIWGYAPLIVSLANTKEVLYLVNRSGNEASHQGCVPWIDRAIDLVAPQAGKVTLRGDTDFTLTGELDRWDGQGVDFILGMDAHPKVVGLAEALGPAAWRPLERMPAYEIATEPRAKPDRVKEAIVRLKGYTNQKLTGESVAEIDYRPVKCGRSYRLIILRKNISVQQGEKALLDEIRYFFYLTNKSSDLVAEAVVGLANERCDQENVIEQLKNGVNALRMPVDNLESNWAYMIMAGLAWNLKAWFGLLVPDRARGLELVKMEFRRFLHSLILIPAQIIRGGRRIVYRLLAYNPWLTDLFAVWKRLQAMAPG